MKTKVLSIALAFASITAIAQKKEIRSAQKAIEAGNYTEAKKLLASVESIIGNESNSRQADFYLAQGKAFALDKNNQGLEELLKASKALNKAKDLGEADEATKQLLELKNNVVNSAIEDQNNQKYKAAAEKLYSAYKLNPTDTVYLYYAASNYVNQKEFDKAITYYEELRDLGFTGKGTEYTAVNKETGQRETFQSEKQRDLFVKSGQYSDPASEKLPSKRGEITKNLALIYLEKNQEDKAINAIEDAKKENPNDTQLLLAEANVYNQMGKTDKYAEVIEKVIELDPNNATLYYNLGVTSTQMNQPEKAITYYKKAIAIDPDMNEAYINMASTILTKEKPLIDEMNSLGMSAADNKRYDELSKQRKDIYREAIPYLEKVVEKNPTHTQAKQTLKSIYLQLGEEAKAKALN